MPRQRNSTNQEEAFFFSGLNKMGFIKVKVNNAANEQSTKETTLARLRPDSEIIGISEFGKTFWPFLDIISRVVALDTRFKNSELQSFGVQSLK